MRRLLFYRTGSDRLICHPSFMIAPESSGGKSPSCGFKVHCRVLRHFEHRRITPSLSES